ncbi:MAG: hypothetical protein DRN27_06485 [Thermoplasmata archaeon]|nr:MAG: hypothetical protein DRN27_06485 [Thermoplasmata archaeon]
MEKGCDDKECLVCKQPIDFSKDLFVCLGTYDGDRTVDESYFHMTCWRTYFEEKARDKAMAVVNGMQERMQPIAEQMMGKLKKAIDERSEKGSTPMITV